VSVSVEPGVGVGGTNVGVAVGVGVTVGVAVAVGVGVGVGVGVAMEPSNAPISQSFWPGAGRRAPRWSVVSGSPLALVQLAGGTWSIAGLIDSSAMVFVGPPLSASPMEESSASVLF
jgi:hypothetical protein